MTMNVRRTAATTGVQHNQQVFGARAAASSTPISFGQGEKHDYTKLERTTNSPEANAGKVMTEAFNYFDAFDAAKEFAWCGR